jgi:hypothetical protein
MADGRRKQRAGLLAMALNKRVLPTVLMPMVLLLMAAPLLFSQNEAGSRVLIQSSPDKPAAGSPWILTLLIDHYEPDEVEVLAPHFGDSLFLELVLKLPRTVNSDERWTAMEYRFVLNSPGTVEFESFAVITPHGQTMTNPFELTIQQPQASSAAQIHKFAWEKIPSGLKTGEEAVFILRYSGKNSLNQLPEAELFLPPVPPGHIMESIRLADSEKTAGIALKLRLIPLESSPFAVARRQFSHGGHIFEIPALRITVTPSANAPSAKATTAQNTTPATNTATEKNTPPFPTLTAAIRDHSKLYQKHRADCESIHSHAKNLWEKTYNADALAALRKNERDHPAGAFFAVIRREAERSLGLSGTKDEEKRSFMPFWREKRRSAVLRRETAIFRVPDRSSEEIARFGEGHPVLLDGKPHSHRSQIWLQVTTHDDNGISGWVPEENIIIY